MKALKQKIRVILATCVIAVIVINISNINSVNANAQEMAASNATSAVSANENAASDDATAVANADSTTPQYIGRGYVTCKELKLRNQPVAKGFNTIEVLENGAIVNIIQETEEYYQVEVDNSQNVGFVDKNFVAIPDQNPASYGLISAAVISCKKSSENRNYNMALACQKLNGLVLQPGEQFDWYGANGVGQANTANGFKPAPVIINKHSVMGVGGGVCQVCTTLYNVLLHLGIIPDEIHHHSIGSHYAAPGMDATVTYPSKDFKFTNPYQDPIMIEAFTDGGSTVTVLCYTVVQPTE